MSNFYPESTIAEINAKLDIRRLMQAIDYRFDKFQENAKTAKGFCPIHREGLFRNLVIDKEARTFRCQYTQCAGSQGGSLVSLFAQARGLDVDAAARTIVHEQALQVELPVNQEMIERDLTAANALLEGGEDDPAEAAFLQILEAAPNNADAHHGLLKVYDKRGAAEQRKNKLPTVCRLMIAAGRTAEIPELIQEWSETDSDSPEARFACAELLHAQGETESAVMELMGGGDACEGSGDLEAALHAYRRAAALSAEHNIDVIDVTPHVVRVLTQMGRHGEALEHLWAQADRAANGGDTAGAIELIIMALEIQPDNGDLHRRFLELAPSVAPTSVIGHHVVQSAQYLRTHEDHDLGMQALENYLAIAPSDENALQALINEYNNHGKAKEALDLESQLARVVYEAGRHDEAQEIIERVLTWQPQHVATLESLAYFQEQEGLLGESAETHRRIARALLSQRKFAEALDAIQKLDVPGANPEELLDLKSAALEGLGRAGDPAARDAAVAALENLGDQLMEQTNSRRAIGYLQRAVDLLESAPAELLFKLARAHLRNKDFPQVRDTVITACEGLAARDRLDEAILEAERYSNLIPQDTDLVRYLVELYLRFDDKTAAVARMRRLANDLAQGGRNTEADEVLEQANDLEPQNLDSLEKQLEAYRLANREDKVLQTQLRLAAWHEQENNYQAAAATLQDYLKARPDDSAAATRIVNAFDKLEDAAEARQWRLYLARTYRTAGDSDREARTLRDILAKLPDDEETLHMLVNAEFNRGDLQLGAATARRLAKLQMNAGKTENARKTLLKAAERVPENLEINRDIYDLHRGGNQPNQALTWGRKVINILRNGGKNAEAAIIFDQLIELDPDNLPLKQEQLRFLEETGRDAEVAEKRLALAALYRKQERFRDAEAMLEAVLKLDSRNLPARQALADLYLHLGDNAKAETQLIRMAGIYHLEGNSSKAMELLRQVITTNAGNAEARRQVAQIYRSEGEIGSAISELLALADHYRTSQMEVEALACEREAADLDPGNTVVRRRVVDSLKEAGRSNQAADELEHIAQERMDAGNLNGALETLDEVLQVEPQRLSTRKKRADLLMRLGRTEDALAELQSLADIALAGNSAPATVAPVSGARADLGRAPLQLVKEYTFETFVVGANNDFAYATALAIARSPARAYNPLFLYANVGLGKTHLCNAIANFLLEHDPRSRIIYTNSEDFTDELVEAIQNNAVPQFRNRYRSLDLLIVDDVQFLAGKERAQEEFFHIFNSLFQARRQIVVTSDRPPSEIAHLESRLRSRFGAGVIVDIASPDLETRLAILNREIEESHLELEHWVARLLSERVDTNVRDLKGALNQVVAMRDLRKQAVTEDSVGKMLETLYPTSAV